MGCQPPEFPKSQNPVFFISMTEQDAEKLKQQGLWLFHRREYAQALQVFETAVSAYTTLKNDTGRAEALNNIGVIYRLQGNPRAAITALNEAEIIFARLGEPNRRAQALGNLGDLHQAGRNRQEAARCYSEAAALFAQTKDGEKQAQVLRALSLMRLRQGYWVEAMMRMRESLSVRPSLGIGQFLFKLLLSFALRLLAGPSG